MRRRPSLEMAEVRCPRAHTLGSMISYLSPPALMLLTKAYGAQGELLLLVVAGHVGEETGASCTVHNAMLASVELRKVVKVLNTSGSVLKEKKINMT